MKRIVALCLISFPLWAVDQPNTQKIDKSSVSKEKIEDKTITPTGTTYHELVV